MLGTAVFGFGRQERISSRAGELGKLLHHLVSCVEMQPFETFVEAGLREGIVESYTDRSKRSFGFFEAGPHQDEFSFHATYDLLMGPMLTVEGHRQYYGLKISGSKLGHGISVDVSDLIQAGLGDGKLGRDAKALQAELLRFPGFHSISDLKAQLLG